MNNPSFPNMTDEQVKTFLINQGYSPKNFRKLPDGEWILLHQLAFTLSVCCGVSYDSMFKYRWCFKNPQEAIYFFNHCQEYDEIPVKRESLQGHRYISKPLYIEYDEFGFAKW